MMAERERRATSLMNGNGTVILPNGNIPDLPVNGIADKLTQEQGTKLEINTRANPKLVNAVAFGYVYTTRFHSSYVQGRLDELMRLAVSMDGKGRNELIDCLRAGGSVPDAYYNGQDAPKKRSWGFLRRDSDEGGGNDE